MAVITAGPGLLAELDGEEILAEFARVMAEWGHCRTAAGLCFPERRETARAAERRADLSQNRNPDGSWIPIP